MRLIDVDNLHLNLWVPSKNNAIVKAFENSMIDALDRQPTVEAIPVEWLHSIMEKQLIFAMNSEMEGTTTVQDGVIHCVSGALACQVLANVIELWEKENGTDRQR